VSCLFDFEGMPGVKGTLKGPFIKSVNAANIVLRKRRVVSAAGDFGCVNVYRRDDDKWGCEFQFYQFAIDSKVYKTKNDALKWLKKWLPRVRKRGPWLKDF
jgi:hypothetical protein